MDKELSSGPIGDIGKYEVAFKGGMLLVNANVSLPPGESASVVLQVDAKKVLDALKDAIPGKLDDLAIGLLKTALGI